MNMHRAVVLMMAGVVTARPASTVLMYTDLIQVIGSNDNCSALPVRANTTSKVAGRVSDIAIMLSRFSFSKQNSSLPSGNGEKCVEEDISKHSFNYDWACFSTGSGSTTLSDSNWLFLNCTSTAFLSIACLPDDVISDVRGQLCDNRASEETCWSFNYTTDGKQHACSRTFKIERTVQDTQYKLEFLSPFDIAAYLCVALILVSFLLAVCIPASKCKPQYQHNMSGLRVPLKIYEMYGVMYMPSAKRQLTKSTDKWKRKMSQTRPHSRNLAILAALNDISKRNEQMSKANGTRGSSSTPSDDAKAYDEHASALEDADKIQPDAKTSGDFRRKSLKGHVNVSFTEEETDQRDGYDDENDLISVKSDLCDRYDISDNVMTSAKHFTGKRHSLC